MDLWPEILTALAGASVPAIGFLGNYWIKRTPEAKSPSEVITITLEHVSSELEKTSTRLDRAYEKIEEERESRRKLEDDLNAKITVLNSQIERLWNNTVNLKKHIVTLEHTLTSNNIDVPIRPPEVESLFCIKEG